MRNKTIGRSKEIRKEKESKICNKAWESKGIF